MAIGGPAALESPERSDEVHTGFRDDQCLGTKLAMPISSASTTRDRRPRLLVK